MRFDLKVAAAFQLTQPHFANISCLDLIVRARYSVFLVQIWQLLPNIVLPCLSSTMFGLLTSFLQIFWKDLCQHCPTVIHGTAVEMVESYKYLGTIIDSHLNFEQNTSQICKKGAQRLYFLRSLNFFNVDKTLMVLFYRSFIECVLPFCLVSFYENLSVQNKTRLNRAVVEAAVLLVRSKCLSRTFTQNRSWTKLTPFCPSLSIL